MQQALIDIVKAAGDEVLEVYGGAFAVETKADQSPLTEADLRAQRVIVHGLRELTPDLPILSEEAPPPPFAVRRSWRRYWLVDPLDGTKEFVSRNGEFTINVALIDAGAPVLGVVGVPVRGDIYVGDRATGRAWRQGESGHKPLRARRLNDAAVTVVASRRHGGQRLADYLHYLAGIFDQVVQTPVGSSLKLCILAEGEADLYPRLGPTSEWDTAAAHAVLAAAGGAILRGDGGALVYNTKASLLNPDFLAVADPEFPWREHLPARAPGT